jgi:hypothetical protein
MGKCKYLKLNKMREKLINLIMSYAGDELIMADVIDIAKESEEELLDRVANILDYYVHEYNN